MPPTPQFASLRSSDYHSLYFNPDPAIKYEDWAPGNNGTTTRNYDPISVANALASPPSVMAPLHPNNTAVTIEPDGRPPVAGALDGRA